MKKYRLVFDPQYMNSWYFERRSLFFFWDFMAYTMSDSEEAARKSFADGPPVTKKFRVVDYV